MWGKSSVVKPAFKNVIGVNVLMSMLLNAFVMYECGIMGETLEIIIFFDCFSNLRIGMMRLLTVIDGLELIISLTMFLFAK
jgi:hypothetical protein